MIPGDLKKLVGGYATGTLTPEERQALFQAALEDQGLFEELAREQALRDVLSDRAARTRLLAALDRQPAPWWRLAVRTPGAWWSMPAAALAAAAVLSICVLAGYRAWHSHPQPAVREVAALRPAAPPGVAENGAVSVPAAKPQALVRRPPARSDAVRQSAPVSRTARPAAQSTSGAIGSLVPETPAPAPEPAATPPTSRDAAETGPRPAATQEPVQAQPADNALGVNRPAVPTARSGAAGNDFLPARRSIMPVLGAAVAAPLRWTVLRRNDADSFDLIGLPDLRAGDIIELRLESASDGEISLSEGAPGEADSPLLLPATHIVSGQALITPPIAPASPGLRVLTIRFTPSQGQPISAVVRLNYR